MHPEFFGYAGCGWPKAGAAALLAIKLCIETTAGSTSLIGGLVATQLPDLRIWDAPFQFGGSMFRFLAARIAMHKMHIRNV